MNSECPHLPSISLLADEELPPAEREDLMAHLRTCEACTREFEDLMLLRTVLRGVTTDAQARERVYRALPARRSTPFRWKRTSVPFPIAASILLLLGISVAGNALLVFRGSFFNSAVAPNPGLIQPKTQNGPETTAGEGPRSPSLTPSSGKSSATIGTAQAKPFVLTLESDQWSVEYVTKTQFRPYAVPKIYTGGNHRPSEQR